MLASTRFLTAGLAAVAVASAVTLSTPAYAEDGPTRGCGQPAVPAVYVTVIHEPELRLVPAVTHDEWRWQREVTTEEYEFSRVVTPAFVERDWTREVPGVTEYLWSHRVVDQAAVPAVPGTPEQGHLESVVVTPAVTVTLFEFVQQQTGKTRWETEGWNAEHEDGDKGLGWFRSGTSRVDVLTPAVTEQHWVVDHPAVPATPAVPEVSHTETTWSADSPGADWSGPLDTRTVGGGTESVTTTGDEVPAGDGWTEVATHAHDAVTDVVWALHAPDGYLPTGGSRVHDVAVETTDDVSATPPEGAGWSKVADSAVTKVDVEAHSEQVGEGSIEQVLAAPALPATDPCPAPAAGHPAGAVDGPSSTGANDVSATTHQHTSTSVAAASSATVLPATGNPASPWLLAAGAGALLAGGALVRVGRRRTT